MNFKLLNYPAITQQHAISISGEIISSVHQDIIAVQQMTSQAGVDGFKDSVKLNHYLISIFGFYLY
jgi:hypothetical protein